MSERAEEIQVRPASEIFGQRERPYDMRWGTPEQVKAEFGIGVSVLKSAWATGWVRARQGNWESDEKRTQSVYCFEDIHQKNSEVSYANENDFQMVW